MLKHDLTHACYGTVMICPAYWAGDLKVMGDRGARCPGQVSRARCPGMSRCMDKEELPQGGGKQEGVYRN